MATSRQPTRKATVPDAIALLSAKSLDMQALGEAFAARKAERAVELGSEPEPATRRRRAPAKRGAGVERRA